MVMAEAPEETRIDLRVTVELRRKVRQAAGKANLTTAEWVRRTIEEAADRELKED
jgi:uncharacterized protein (DUF1778 family)